ncbi:MAG: hypothetical protein U0998_09115 [Moraxellaceae bacterium]|nr:hypothetical protein [Moraxellaceae bacterium]MDZ4387341.1 hypothetical protein [Moraxellaceae bacterium]
MSTWLNPVCVGSNSSFGEVVCKITYFRGRVVQVNHNQIPITHVSGGGGSIHGSSSVYDGYGGGYVSGRIDPIRSHTEIKTNFKMWVRSAENKDFSWSSDHALEVANGQDLTLIFLNGQMVAFVNHNSDSWFYVRSDDEIADIAGQRGYLVSNNDELKQAKDLQENGVGYGVLVGTITFLTALFIENCNFWNWSWIEEPSSRLWYVLPSFLALGGIVGMWRKFRFWYAAIISLGIGFGSWFFGYERWGAVIVLLQMCCIFYQPPKAYGLYVNNAAVTKLKEAIYNNANFALRSFN